MHIHNETKNDCKIRIYATSVWQQKQGGPITLKLIKLYLQCELSYQHIKIPDVYVATRQISFFMSLPFDKNTCLIPLPEKGSNEAGCGLRSTH